MTPPPIVDPSRGHFVTWGLWVAWPVSLWHKRAGVATSWSHPILSSESAPLCPDSILGAEWYQHADLVMTRLFLSISLGMHNLIHMKAIERSEVLRSSAPILTGLEGGGRREEGTPPDRPSSHVRRTKWWHSAHAFHHLLTFSPWSPLSSSSYWNIWTQLDGF